MSGVFLCVGYWRADVADNRWTTTQRKHTWHKLQSHCFQSSHRPLKKSESFEGVAKHPAKTSTLLNTIRYYTILLNTTQYYSRLLSTTQCYSILLNTTQHYSILLNTTQHYSGLLSTTQYYSMLRNTTQYYSTLANTTQYKMLLYTVQWYSILLNYWIILDTMQYCSIQLNTI